MAGWAPFDVDGWPEVAEALTEAGRAWPRAAAVFDLRWHIDQGKPIPGRPSLIRRWRWTGHAVRVFLANADTWQDPRKRTKTVRQRAASRPPADRQPPHGRNGTIPEDPPAHRQPIASRPPAPIVDPHSHSHSQATHTCAAGEWDRAQAAWLDAARSMGKKPRALKRSRGMGAQLARAIKRWGIDDVLAVIGWWGTSNHKRATYLRNEGYGLDTLIRPSKFEGYLALTSAPDTLAPRPGQWFDPE